MSRHCSKLLSPCVMLAAGARPVDVAVGGAGSPDSQPYADLAYAAAPGPRAWGQPPYADVVFVVAAPRAALTGDRMELSGVHSTQHFVTADLGTGGIATGAPACGLSRHALQGSKNGHASHQGSTWQHAR